MKNDHEFPPPVLLLGGGQGRRHHARRRAPGPGGADHQLPAALLEQSLGKTLFTQQGRRLVLTEAGRLALSYADQIFLLGEQMQEALNEADSGASA
jgi:hypothetical protein